MRLDHVQTIRNESRFANGNASKAIIYIYYSSSKENCSIEVYVDFIENINVVELCRSRTANHNFPTEIGRWNNTNRHNGICTYCNKMNSVKNFIIFLDCPFISTRSNDLNIKV